MPIKDPMIVLVLSERQIEVLLNLLLDEAQRMDDDGNEGAFKASPLFQIYHVLKNAKKG